MDLRLYATSGGYPTTILKAASIPMATVRSSTSLSVPIHHRFPSIHSPFASEIVEAVDVLHSEFKATRVLKPFQKCSSWISWSKFIPKVVLSCSVRHQSMPVLGFGTVSNSTDSTLLKTAALEAIKLGYRHFDTASLYGSEQALGEAIAEALKLGLVGSRDELFITSKLWMTDAHPHRVIPALQKSLQNLQLEYLDLYLVHWPISAKPGKVQFPIKEEDIMPMDYKSVWAAMEESQRLGLTKSIGVSNFSTKKLQNLLSLATIPPAVNQVEMNPIWQQKMLIEFCKANNIIVTAYSPLGAKGTPWGSNHVMDNQVLKDIALARGKTVAQVCLRWIYEQGATSVPKSYNKERLKENLDIFDWELTEEDRQKISQLPQKKLIRNVTLGNGTDPNFLQELWDGEL